MYFNLKIILDKNLVAEMYPDLISLTSGGNNSELAIDGNTKTCANIKKYDSFSF